MSAGAMMQFQSAVAALTAELGKVCSWAGNALANRQRIERRLREIPQQILRAQTELEGLLAEKLQLQQQKRRAEVLIAFGTAPRLLREDQICPQCFIDHGTRVRLVAAPDSLHCRCSVCRAEFNLEKEC